MPQGSIPNSYKPQKGGGPSHHRPKGKAGPGTLPARYQCQAVGMAVPLTQISRFHTARPMGRDPEHPARHTPGSQAGPPAGRCWCSPLGSGWPPPLPGSGRPCHLSVAGEEQSVGMPELAERRALGEPPGLVQAPQALAGWRQVGGASGEDSLAYAKAHVLRGQCGTDVFTSGGQREKIARCQSRSHRHKGVTQGSCAERGDPAPF